MLTGCLPFPSLQQPLVVPLSFSFLPLLLNLGQLLYTACRLRKLKNLLLNFLYYFVFVQINYGSSGNRLLVRQNA
jgi:hypothetical protein